MHGPACIFWANLTPFSLKRKLSVLSDIVNGVAYLHSRRVVRPSA